MSDLGPGNEGYLMAPSVRHIASMVWKRNVVLSLILVRFCDSMPTNDIPSPILINVYQLIGNSDIYKRVHTCPGVSHDVINRKKYQLFTGA